MTTTTTIPVGTAKTKASNKPVLTKVNDVLKTSDLDMFKLIEGNRIPNPQHIRRLKSSIEQNGMLCNPILVNERFEVIDGQHRLAAAKEANSPVYYIILKGYKLDHVHTLNQNQKNWTKRDFMDGYAEMGIESYVKLRNFVTKNTDYNLNDCISLCSNITTSSSTNLSQRELLRRDNKGEVNEVFQEGTWKGKDFELAQLWADKIRSLSEFYEGYNRTSFVGTMVGMFKRKEFNFEEFKKKLRLQPTKLVDCASREQYKILIEEIYNHRSRNKVNLRY